MEPLPLSSDAVRSAPTRFVILTKSRNGLKWLVELLDCHTGVSVFGEVFGSPQTRGYGSSAVSPVHTYLESVRLRRTSFAPVGDVPRQDVVENFADVRRALSATRFEWMLGDPAGAESTRATR